MERVITQDDTYTEIRDNLRNARKKNNGKSDMSLHSSSKSGKPNSTKSASHSRTNSKLDSSNLALLQQSLSQSFSQSCSLSNDENSNSNNNNNNTSTSNTLNSIDDDEVSRFDCCNILRCESSDSNYTSVTEVKERPNRDTFVRAPKM
jgi:hypothetical protein